MAKNKRFIIATNLTISVASIRRNLLKTTHAEEHRFHTNSEGCNINSDRKIINLILNKSIRYDNR